MQMSECSAADLVKCLPYGGRLFSSMNTRYAKRQATETARRKRKQTEYVEDFRGAVLAFLDFAPSYALLAEQLADAVTKHATPVGSGTVALCGN